MIDFHSHLIPGVDDGAQTIEEALEGVDRLSQGGVRVAITTPHLLASITTNQELRKKRLEEIDRGWQALKLGVEGNKLIALERGAEVMLDVPRGDFADPRTRLAGSFFVLVEFPFMTVPPNSTKVLEFIRRDGWFPVLAHPERYPTWSRPTQVSREWRAAGAFLQVNCGSLAGHYGEAVRSTAWKLLEEGLVDYLGSDYHARGQPAIEDCKKAMVRVGGDEQFRVLTEVNPGRLRQSKVPIEINGLRRRRFWQIPFGK